MTTKHTPGPWFIDANAALPLAVITDTAEFDGIGICELGERSEESTANAKLIAAAPDMLEALQEVARVYEYTDARIGELARAAIAKALGE